MRKTSLVIFMLTLFSITAISAETPEQRLLRLQRQREQNINLYTYTARSTKAREEKLDVLNQILAEFSQLEYTQNDRGLVDLGIYLSGEGTLRAEYSNNRLTNDFYEVRAKACELLGRIGGEPARDALVNILMTDTNPEVLIQAIRSLETIGDNTRGDALRTLVYLYRSSYRPDPRMVYAIINAVKTVAKNNVSGYADAVYVLTEIRMSGYNNQIRQAAYDALQELKNIE